jgi:ABC-type amino acid transport substrate-binding protein
LDQTTANQGQVACLTIQPLEYVIATDRGDMRLMTEINAALAEMKSDGTMTRIAQRWLGNPAQPR